MATRLQFDVSALDNASRTFVALAAQIERFASRLDRLDGTRADVEINADTSRAERDIGAFATKMRRDLEAAVKALPKITLDADSSDADRKVVELRGKIEELSGKTVGVDIDAGAAMAEITALQDELRALDASSANVQVKADVAAALAALAAANGEVDRLDGRKATIKIDVDKSLSDSIIQVARLGAALGSLAMPAAMIAAAPQLVSLAGAAVQASGALLLLPAAGLAAAAAVGTLAVGFAHVTDALGPTGTAAQMKKVNEALALLSPAARAAVGEIRNLGPAWRELSLDVQQRLFLGVSSAIADLAGKYLPLLRGAMDTISTSFNAAFIEVSKFLAAPATVSMISGMFTNLAATVRNLAGTFAPLVTIFLQVASIGSQYLPGLTNGFTGLVTKVRDFVTSAEGIAQIKEWIQGGIDAIKSLFSIVSSGGGILSGLFDAAKGAGVDFLGTLSSAASLTDTFLNSGVGQTALTSIFKSINDTVGALVPGLVAVGAALGQGLVALGPSLPGLAKAFSDMAIAVAPLLTDLLSLVSLALAPLSAALSGLSPILGPVTAGLLAMWAAVKVMSAMSAISAGLTAFTIATGAMTATAAASAGPLALLSGAIRGVGLAIAANPIGIIIVALVAITAAVIYCYTHFEGFRNVVDSVLNFIVGIATTVGGWFAGPFAGFFVSAFEAIKGAVTAVADFFVGAFDGIKTAVGAVVDFFVNLPANIAAALAALGAAIASGAAAAWEWLITTLQTVGANVLSFLADLPKNVAYALGFLVGAIVKGFLTVVDAVIALPGQIAAGLQALGEFLASAAVAAGTAFVDAIVTAFNATITWFQELPGRIGAALSAMGTFLADVAVTAGTAFLDAIVTGFNAVVTFFVNLPGQIVAGLTALGTMLVGAAISAGTGFLDGIVTGFNAVITWFTNLPGVIGGFFSAAGTWLLTVGGDIINGLISGLTNAGTAVLTWLGGLVDSFVQGFKDALGIASPSTVFAELGGFIIDGLISGLQAMGAAILAVVQGIGQFLLDAFTTAISFLTGLWSSFWAGLQAEAVGFWNLLTGFISAAWAAIQAAFSFAIGVLVAAWDLMWSTLSTAATTVFNAILSVVTTVWNAIQGAFNTAIAFIKALWDAYWAGLQATATAIWNAVLSVVTTVWAAIQNAFNVAVTFVTTLWNNFWAALQLAATTLWNAILFMIQTVWAAIQAGFNAAVAFVVGLWNGFWTGLQATATAVWNAILAFIGSVWAAIQDSFNAAVTFVVGLWNGFWDGLAAVAKTVFNAVKSTIDTVIDGIVAAFNFVVNKINEIWTGIKRILAVPINFMIGTVYNDGIVKAWNFVAGLLGIGGINPMPLIPEFATGGQVPGFGNGDTVEALLTPGEFVVRKQVAEPLMPFLTALNDGQAEAVQAAGGQRRRYAAGGAVQAGLDFAAAQNGKPYIWGGVGPEGYDCSGLLSAVTNVLRGQNPYKRLGVAAGQPWSGFQPGMNGTWSTGFNSGHTAGTLAGVNIESGSTPIKFPAGAGADSSQFSGHAWLPEVGGAFVSGGAGGGGFFNWILDQVRKIYKSITDPLPGMIRGFIGAPPPAFRDVPPKIAEKAINDVGDFLFGKAEAAGGGVGGVDTSGPVQQQVQQIAAQFGWGDGAEWDAIVKTVQAESGWNPNAQNANSSAAGLFQKMQSVHGPVESTPAGQAQWGLGYIRDRYGDPINEWAFHQAHGYYDNGGMATGAGFLPKATVLPERVLSPTQTLTFQRMVDAQFQPQGLPGVGLSPAGIEARLDNLASTMGRQIGSLADTLERRGAAATIQIQDRSGDPTETARSTMLALRMS